MTPTPTLRVLDDLTLDDELPEDHLVVDPGRQVEQHDPEQAEEGQADHVVQQAERGRPGGEAAEGDDHAQVVAGHLGGNREVRDTEDETAVRGGVPAVRTSEPGVRSRGSHGPSRRIPRHGGGTQGLHTAGGAITAKGRGGGARPRPRSCPPCAITTQLETRTPKAGTADPAPEAGDGIPRGA
ncbi:MAG: hypothetical protein OXH52_06050 [Gammaproteobacteria bacterium]|nr:hypothetical protein [Gammaproteobacteria bacterium]